MQASHIPTQLPRIEIITNLTEVIMSVKINTKVELTPLKFSGVEDKKIGAVEEWVAQAWQTIAPFWPLKNLIATNPLQGLEDLLFEQALTESVAYFQQAELPQPMNAINRETIKWCQAYFDEDQSTLSMPNRQLGLYKCWRQLACHDDRLHGSDPKHRAWLRALPDSSEQTIAVCLHKLDIPYEKTLTFLTLLITTLPGWAGYIKYRTQWPPSDKSHLYPITQQDYLAMRLVITTLLWSRAIDLLGWHQRASLKAMTMSSSQLSKIVDAEKNYRAKLLTDLSQQKDLINTNDESTPLAQLVFCIDVRSEPFRRAIESQGNYETYGFAGFFGIPVKINDPVSEECFSSCPVLLTPSHIVKETLMGTHQQHIKNSKGKAKILLWKGIYQALKYNFTTPFVLVEILGLWTSLWMLLKTVVPRQAKQLKQIITGLLQPALLAAPFLNEQGEVNGIPFQEQCAYAESALRMINLTNNFAPLVVLCGHGSTTENNAYASALDCGACGGHRGDSNARIMAAILNNRNIRKQLSERGIFIPDETKFVGGLHNTTTDEVTLYLNVAENDITFAEQINKLKLDLESARKINNYWRSEQLGYMSHVGREKACGDYIERRSADWAQTRPEWGLARNATFIVAPRSLTKNIDLNGRAFLHSYCWEEDANAAFLETILTAPMVVAQWINNQYLFSTLDNVAYGSGSKITHNVTGKIGVMQGNGSDLMHGLPLQSLYSNDTDAYHEPIRLIAIVNAPRDFISQIISRQQILQKLFGNGWVVLVCMDPENAYLYELQRNFTWQKISF
jgi:uncharacterized protein YbcC (UPF0753/DUF2309 family)